MSHTHTHGCCDHCLHHCSCCNEVYCCKCGETWRKYGYYYPWTYPFTPSYPTITWTCDGSTTTIGDYKFGSTSGGTTTYTTCSHKHKGGE